MISCPSCSTWKHGQWLACRPALHFGQRSHRHTLNACTTGCAVFGDGPGWLPEFDGPVPLSGAEDLMPKRIRSREHCEAVVTRWWRRRVARYDVSRWPSEKLEKWRALE